MSPRHAARVGRGQQVGALGPVAPLVPDVGKIAVVRANAVGDYVLATPALESLRAAYPDAEIVLIGNRWHADFLPGRPGPVDRVVVPPTATGVREPSPDEPEDPDELDAFFARMRDERFDLAVQLHGGGAHSNPFVRRLGARVGVGLCAEGAEPLDRSAPYVYWQHETTRWLEVVGLAGAPAVRVEPVVAVTDDDRAEAGAVLAGEADGRRPDDERPAGPPLAVLHPGATDPRRRWPPDRFAAVGDALAAAGARVVVTGTAEEKPVVDDLLAAARADLVPLVGVLSLGGLAGLLDRAAVVVSNDTGPRHLAEAVGTPTVGVYWAGNLINAGPHLRARHRPHLSWTLACPECGAAAVGPDRGCDHDCSFVRDVAVEPVVADALDLLRGR